MKLPPTRSYPTHPCTTWQTQPQLSRPLVFIDTFTHTARSHSQPRTHTLTSTHHTHTLTTTHTFTHHTHTSLLHTRTHTLTSHITHSHTAPPTVTHSHILVTYHSCSHHTPHTVTPTVTHTHTHIAFIHLFCLPPRHPRPRAWQCQSPAVHQLQGWEEA